ncbi:MAG: ComEC/Rec2 family competence protein, partial [Anaerolineales bacterium]
AGLFLSVFGRWFGARRGGWIAAAAIFLYTLLVGADPAVQRAAVMGGLALTARHLGRQTHGLASLSTAAIIMTLINPRTLWDVGFQLSFFATLGLILYANPLREGAIRFLLRWLTPKQAEKIANPFSEFFLFTLAAQITTLPLTAIHFQRLSLVSVLANPVILPLQPLLMIMGGLASLLGALWIPLGQPIAWAAWLFPAFTNQAVRFFAGWPAASIPLGSFGFPLVLAYYILLLGGTWVLSLPPDRRPGRATLIRLQADTDLRLRLGLVALAVISGLTWHMLAHQPDGDLHLMILDVGEGDAVLLRSPNGGAVLINGGASPIRLTDMLGRYTSIFERELDWLIIGGTSYDQIGGLTGLSDRFVIRQSLIPRSSGKGSFQRVLEDLDENSTPKTIYEPGHRLVLGEGAFLEILSVSDSGALMMVQWDSARILLAPGADPDLILDSMNDPCLRSVSAVLLPAGGYAAVNPEEWLEHLNPGVILLSLRTGEMPVELPTSISSSPANAPVLRTDIHGTIDLTTDGCSLWIEVERAID